MFKREHHIKIMSILQALDSECLVSNRCYFGGGTAIVLSHREYRESLDLDFLISDPVGYRTLRQRMTGSRGIRSIVRSGYELDAKGEIRADQYGIRTLLAVGGAEIKFEIVFEGRIPLEEPSPDDRICNVATLKPLDMAASKLLANSDRWSDDGVFSRDLIDLAMLELPKPIFAQAKKKAAMAYGDSVERDLNRAVTRLAERTGRLDECMSALKMDGVPKALLWSRIRKLKSRSRV